MNQPLPRKTFSDRNKLSRQVFALTLTLITTGAGTALAKETTAKNTAVKAEAPAEANGPACKLPPGHPPGGHHGLPPGLPPFGPMGGPAGAPPPPPPPMLSLPLMGVDLSDDQVEKLAQLQSSFMDQSAPAVFKLHSLESQFRTALGASNLNVDELNGLRTKIAAQKVLVDTAAGDFAIAQAQVLTAEQRHQIKLDMERMEVQHGFGPHPGP